MALIQAEAVLTRPKSEEEAPFEPKKLEATITSYITTAEGRAKLAQEMVKRMKRPQRF